MKKNIHRINADAARSAAATSDLPNVRDRHLRSAKASDAIADIEERTAASANIRLSEVATRQALKQVDADDMD